MKKLIFIYSILFSSHLAISQNDFIMKWDLSKSGSSTSQISFNVIISNDVSFSWVGSPSGTTGSGIFTNSEYYSYITIDGFVPNDIITLNISPINFKGIRINNVSDAPRLIEVNQWGSTNWDSMSYAFHGCVNLQILATDTPNLGNVKNMDSMFRTCSKLNSPNNLNTWNTASVIDMSYMFHGAALFNQNISGWNTISVTDMSHMFEGATSFNQNIGAWNTSNVKSLAAMFSFATNFNQDIGSWITNNVENMYAMFYSATNFNQNIELWNTSKVMLMSYIFFNSTSFNKNLGAWSLNSISTLGSMLDNSGLDCTNYSNTIIGWAANPLTPNSLNLGSNGISYDEDAVVARNKLIIEKGWTILGDNNSCPSKSIISIKSGMWNDPTIWSTNQIPTEISKVKIILGHVIYIPINYSAKAKNIENNGEIKFEGNSILQLN